MSCIKGVDENGQAYIECSYEILDWSLPNKEQANGRFPRQEKQYVFNAYGDIVPVEEETGFYDITNKFFPIPEQQLCPEHGLINCCAFHVHSFVYIGTVFEEQYPVFQCQSCKAVEFGHKFPIVVS